MTNNITNPCVLRPIQPSDWYDEDGSPKLVRGCASITGSRAYLYTNEAATASDSYDRTAHDARSIPLMGERGVASHVGYYGVAHTGTIFGDSTTVYNKDGSHIEKELTAIPNHQKRSILSKFKPRTFTDYYFYTITLIAVSCLIYSHYTIK